MQIHKSLAHLSEQQIQELSSRYFSGETIKDLLREFTIDCLPAQLYKLLPEQVAEGHTCPYCNTSMFHEVPSRTAMTSRYRQEVIYCQNCGHRMGSGCRCPSCIAREEAHLRMQREEQRAGIVKFCSCRRPASPQRFSINKLSLRTAVALLALVRSSRFLDDDETGPGVLQSELTIEALTHATIPLTPSGILDIPLLDELIEVSLICPSELSSDKAFNFEGRKISTYSPVMLRWGLLCADPISLLEEIERCAADRSQWPTHWESEVPALWFDIALSECKEFYRYAATERGLPESGATSTEMMLKNLLSDYSVAQCYRVIYSGAQRAADFWVKNRCTKQHAANYMIGACQRWADKARTENWDVSGYKRNYNLPRSALSHVFFDLFLKIGEAGFTSVLNRELAT